MNHRLKDLPVYATFDVELAAPRFNRARLAVLRLGTPLYLHIKELKHLGMVVEDDAWICFDEVLHEFPVVAWTEFQTHSRQGLNDPVRCRMLFYHAHAELIAERVLAAMDVLLEQLLAPVSGA